MESEDYGLTRPWIIGRGKVYSVAGWAAAPQLDSIRLVVYLTYT